MPPEGPAAERPRSIASMRDRLRARRLRRAVDAVPYWHHSIDLGSGVVTPGLKTPEFLRTELSALGLPDLAGRSVLDVGAWDGFYAFEAERRGAARVVALDSYVWNLDLRAWAPEERRAGYPEPSPGRRGFDLAREALGSAVEPVVMEVDEMAPERLGSFDVVLMLGVLYHMRHPLAALERALSVTRELLVVETQAIQVAGLEGHAMWEFFEGAELNGDPTNWWVPNARALEGSLRAAGFASAAVVATTVPPPDPEPAAGISHYRAVAHARR